MVEGKMLRKRMSHVNLLDYLLGRFMHVKLLSLWVGLCIF